ncbi:3-octaprenyl-4hydroxybenzoate decarboxylase [Geoalkalibacter ferrihydriticus]|uniref:3-octaprenyl-4-hydroxybenzoate carboxy-lyase n=2 Tax=Geoalkalibacter ferrihydriticus TaxID=392333 RepID=A0A0C2EG56_9BACT|nr:UbiD family decarboxylase domain-containing protein [Geoalkalibacter ferrihydriticus]KIH77603.1 hypothetical protein GFER_02695 [Geoalkalibacter ferrihydriticus DSM 17813]SDL69912.1 3-octaprenyl-4hydroxybenzoate decarboxylase [Geoalkalibacter ferrihydriticus]
MRSLPNFIRQLKGEDDLHEVRVQVDPLLEIAAITDRVCKQPGGGQGLLFRRVNGSALPVATNLYGSERRAALAWGKVAPQEMAGGLSSRLQSARHDDMEACLLNLVRVSPGTEAILESLVLPQVPPDLRSLPALQAWPGDGGRYLTLALVSMRDPDSGRTNWGVYRMQILDRTSAAIHFLPGSQGAQLVKEHARRGLSLPLAVTLGGDPGLLAAAVLPLPGSIDEAAFLSLVRGEAPRLAAGPLTGLPVAADAEIVIEGEISSGILANEGPFGNHTGFYQPAAPAPVFHVQGLYRAEDAIFPATVVGPPPMENIHLVRSGEPLVLALLRHDYPSISGLRYLNEGVFHGCVIVALQSAAPPPLDLARELWRKGPLRRSRLLLFVDAEEELSNSSRLLWRAINQALPGRDILECTGRLAIDATCKKNWPQVRPAPGIAAHIERRWREYGLGG